MLSRKESRGSPRSNVEALRQLSELVQVGLPLLGFEDKRAFLEAMDIRLKTNGDTVTMTGFLSDAALGLVRADKGKQDTASARCEALPKERCLLCQAYQDNIDNNRYPRKLAHTYLCQARPQLTLKYTHSLTV